MIFDVAVVNRLYGMMAWPSVADWGSGMSASCRPQVKLCTGVCNGWPHNAPWCH